MGIAAGLVALAMGASVVAALITGKPWALGAPPVLTRTALADSGLTIEVPSEAAKKRDVSVKKTTTLVGFGTLRDAPVTFEVVLTRMDAALNPAEVDAFLDKARQELDVQAPKDWKRTAPAKLIALGDRPAILVEHDPNADVHVRSYFMVVGEEQVMVRAYARKHRPEAWEGIEEKVAASVR
jgi:hypothetical protein